MEHRSEAIWIPAENRWVPSLTKEADRLLPVAKEKLSALRRTARQRRRMDGWGEIISLYLRPVFPAGDRTQLLAAPARLETGGYDRVYVWVRRRTTRHEAFLNEGFRLERGQDFRNVGGRQLYAVRYVLRPERRIAVSELRG
jgi:hypothetical protein